MKLIERAGGDNISFIDTAQYLNEVAVGRTCLDRSLTHYATLDNEHF